MLHICSSGMACTIKFNVFHFGLLVSFHIANLRLEISGNEVTPGENRENLHPVKFLIYTCMHVYLELSSFLPTHVPSQTHISSYFLWMDSGILGFSSIWTERGWECEKGGCEVEEGV